MLFSQLLTRYQHSKIVGGFIEASGKSVTQQSSVDLKISWQRRSRGDNVFRLRHSFGARAKIFIPSANEFQLQFSSLTTNTKRTSLFRRQLFQIVFTNISLDLSNIWKTRKIFVTYQMLYEFSDSEKSFPHPTTWNLVENEHAKINMQCPTMTIIRIWKTECQRKIWGVSKNLKNGDWIKYFSLCTNDANFDIVDPMSFLYMAIDVGASTRSPIQGVIAVNRIKHVHHYYRS